MTHHYHIQLVTQEGVLPCLSSVVMMLKMPTVQQMVRIIELSMMVIFPFGLFALISGLIALKGLTDGNSSNDASALRAAIVRITAGALLMNMGATTCELTIPLVLINC